jgi:hypothetical protein
MNMWVTQRHLLRKKNSCFFIRFVLRFPYTLHSTRNAKLLGFAASSKTYLCTTLNGYSTWKSTENNFPLLQVLRNLSTLNTDIFSYIDANYPTVCSLRSWQITLETPYRHKYKLRWDASTQNRCQMNLLRVTYCHFIQINSEVWTLNIMTERHFVYERYRVRISAKIWTNLKYSWTLKIDTVC